MAVDTAVVQQLERLSVLMYAHMNASGQWGDMGRDAVVDSFARHRLRLPSQESVTGDHVTRFFAQIKEAICGYGFDQKDVFWLKEHLATSLKDFEVLQEGFLATQGPFYLVGSCQEESLEWVFGKGKRSQLDGYDVIHLEEEIVCSPTLTLAMVALIGERQICVRHESLKTIFFQKWVSQPDTPPKTYRIEEEGSFAIKAQVRSLYGVASFLALSDVQDRFLEDFEETVFHHELGHAVIQHHRLDLPVATLGEASQKFGNTIVMTWLEVLADMAPRQGQLKGPLLNMIEVSKQDPVKAARLFWMYLSDVWFYDTTHTHMQVYTDIVVGIMSLVIDKGSLHFDLLQRWLITHTQTLIAWVESMLSDLEKVLSNTQLLKDGQAFSWEEVVCLSKEATSSILDPYKQYVERWHFVIDVVLATPSNQEAITRYMHVYEEDSYRFLMPLLSHISFDKGSFREAVLVHIQQNMAMFKTSCSKQFQ